MLLIYYIWYANQKNIIMSIKLRKRKRSNNTYSLYLDIYHNGQRKTEYLGLYLTEDKISNKSTQQLAENIRAKRQLELQNQSYGFTSETRRKENFVIYFERLVNLRPADRGSWICTLVKVFNILSVQIQLPLSAGRRLTNLSK